MLKCTGAFPPLPESCNGRPLTLLASSCLGGWGLRQFFGVIVAKIPPIDPFSPALADLGQPALRSLLPPLGRALFGQTQNQRCLTQSSLIDEMPHPKKKPTILVVTQTGFADIGRPAPKWREGAAGFWRRPPSISVPSHGPRGRFGVSEFSRGAAGWF